MLIAIAESKLGISVATYTHLGNAKNLLCREAEKSVYKTCVSRMSSPEDKTQDCRDVANYITSSVRWVKIGGSHSLLGIGESWGI